MNDDQKRDILLYIELLRKDLIIEIEKSKYDIIKCCVGSIFVAVGLFATIVKLTG